MYTRNLETLTRLYSKLKNELGEFIVSALNDETVFEIIVNPDESIWLEKAGEQIHDTGVTLKHDRLLAALGTIAAMNKTEINDKKPSFKGVLPIDGSRVSGAIPPISPDGPMVSIRRHTNKEVNLDNYVEEGRLPRDKADYLRDMIKRRKNIVIAGGTSSGKTTFANALIKEIFLLSPRDRLVTIEDTRELRIQTKNKTQLVTSEEAEITMLDLVRLTMRLRPDRIIVGEVRGGEALDLLMSWNTGHPGGIATVHANDSFASLNRLEMLISRVSVTPMKELIGEVVDVVVFMQEFGGVGRQVAEILEVEEFNGSARQYEFKYIYRHSEIEAQNVIAKE